MSDHPPTHFFGTSFGSRDQADPPYLPPTYLTQYLQPDDGRTGRASMATNSAQSMAAYDRHGNVPNFSAAAMASGVPPLPIFQGWNRDPIPLPPYTSHHGVHTPEYTSSTLHHRQDFPEPSYEPSPKESGPVHSRDAQPHPQATKPIEGELSEGEFEDGFTAADSAPVGPETRHGPAYDGTSYHDTAHRAVYARSPDQSVPQSFSRTGTNYSHNHEPSQRNYQRSDSYSPSTSPREVDYDANSQRHQQQYLQGPTYSQSPQSPRYEHGHTNGILQSHFQQSWTRNGTESSGLRYHVGENHDLKSSENPHEYSNVQGPQGHAVSPSYKSVAEARKKAQGAILNLWPLEVRFQNYIDEGFDESLIQGLFGGIGMPSAPSRTVNEPARSSDQFHDTITNSHDKTFTNMTTTTKSHTFPINGRMPQHTAHPPVRVHGYSNAHDKSENISRSPGLSQIVEPKPLETNAAPEAQPAKADEKEERKDRIARLIAAKANKQLQPKAPLSVPTLASPSSNTAATSTAPQTTVSTEKERLLRLKMEALQKSRDARALKAAAKNNATSSTVAENQQPVPLKQIAAVAALPSPSISPFPTVQQSTDSPTHSPSPVHGISLPPAPPAIPGLFLASSAASPVPSTMPHSIMHNITQINNQRKRPVAADFQGSATTFSSLKRPFGQSRNDQPLVIDVSDDELESDDEDVAMEIDSQVDQSSPKQTTKTLADYRSTALSHLPPLSDFPVGKQFTSRPSSAMNTLPVTQVTTKAILGKPADLQRKEKEIEEMKKKIAEAERRKKAKKTSSGTHTPLAIDATSVERKDNSNVIIAGNVEASIQIEHMINVADNKVNADQQRLAEAQAAELEQAAELKRNEAERKRLRREKIATDLPLVDAEVQQNQIKLEQLRAEMAKIEAAVQKNLADKLHMAEEMEKLGQEAEDQLQAQKDKLRDLTREETESRAASSRPISEPIAEAQRINKIASSSRNQNQSSASPSRDLHPPISKYKPAVVEFAQQPSVPLSNASNALIVASVNDCFAHSSEQRETLSNSTSDESHDGVTSDQALDAALREATARAEAESYATTGSDTDMEDSCAPDLGRLAPQSVTSPVEEERPTSLASALAGDTSSDSSEESDNYEPPEATPPIAEMQSLIESPPFSPAPPEPVIELFQDSIQDDLTVTSLEADNNVQDSIIDSPAPQVQRTAQSTENRHKEHSNHGQFYTPYESPLRHFHVYRFHPDFKQQVPGGFRSMTYSHKIDPKIELCRYELAGGVCNDSTCELQHFRDMGLPDDAVLTALGSPDEYDGERKAKFVAGLREVLQDLRSKKIKDFDIIASEIAAFRSKFLGDNKVLLLKGTSV